MHITIQYILGLFTNNFTMYSNRIIFFYNLRNIITIFQTLHITELHAIPRHITSHHVTPRPTTSHHITQFHTGHTTSHHITPQSPSHYRLYNDTSRHTTSTTSLQAIPRHTTSRHVNCVTARLTYDMIISVMDGTAPQIAFVSSSLKFFIEMNNFFYFAPSILST